MVQISYPRGFRAKLQVDRVLDPDNLSIQLDTLIKAARAVGKAVEIEIGKAPRVAGTA
jgi:hypothetical protein